MPAQFLYRIEAENFRSLRRVSVDLSPLTVLVGPNGAGKSNLLSVIRFLGETARLDLHYAIERFGGFESIRFRGSKAKRPKVRVVVAAKVTKYASANALDEYELTVERYPHVLARRESFKFKRYGGRGRRIQVKGGEFSVSDDGDTGVQRQASLAKGSSALSTLPRLGPDEGGQQVGQLAELFLTFRVFDVDVSRARLPSRVIPSDTTLASDASNLAPFLLELRRRDPGRFEQLCNDLRYVVPGFDELRFVPVGGAAEAVAVGFTESGLPGVTMLADASFGTVRALALLAMLHDPAPPKMTCVEEVDHGLHPHAIDRVVERMREATDRTQLLVATHSPTFVNRLRASELVVCERDTENGESLIPAIDSQTVSEMDRSSDLGLGELWFTGSLGGALE